MLLSQASQLTVRHRTDSSFSSTKFHSNVCDTLKGVLMFVCSTVLAGGHKERLQTRRSSALHHHCHCHKTTAVASHKNPAVPPWNTLHGCSHHHLSLSQLIRKAVGPIFPHLHVTGHSNRSAISGNPDRTTFAPSSSDSTHSHTLLYKR